MKEKYNQDPEALKESFRKECLNTQSFIGNSVSPAFQSLYKKVTDAMFLFNDRTYEGIIDRIFNSGLKKISSMFLNVTRYIIYIVGKITYTKASNKINFILGKYIIIISFFLSSYLFIYISLINIIIFFLFI